MFQIEQEFHATEGAIGTFYLIKLHRDIMSRLDNLLGSLSSVIIFIVVSNLDNSFIME